MTTCFTVLEGSGYNQVQTMKTAGTDVGDGNVWGRRARVGAVVPRQGAEVGSGSQAQVYSQLL